jgi:hypothetical protein
MQQVSTSPPLLGQLNPALGHALAVPSGVPRPKTACCGTAWRYWDGDEEWAPS